MKKITFSQKFKEKYRFQYSMIELAGPFNPFKHSRISFRRVELDMDFIEIKMMIVNQTWMGTSFNYQSHWDQIQHHA